MMFRYNYLRTQPSEGIIPSVDYPQKIPHHVLLIIQMIRVIIR
jgi:hypothetical protein